MITISELGGGGGCGLRMMDFSDYYSPFLLISRVRLIGNNKLLRGWHELQSPGSVEELRCLLTWTWNNQLDLLVRYDGFQNYTKCLVKVTESLSCEDTFASLILSRRAFTIHIAFWNNAVEHFKLE
jgi:hypothetical protein